MKAMDSTKQNSKSRKGISATRDISQIDVQL
ncbi:hypothetical protein T03_5446 [Trichinella britovi]|uniref:Uncharacterized protein n=1 Tax=Trichinella britovi TaxID=45882 RepID=A0A0V0Z7V4_TRIBR|nr:hypothetical protein T03_5446 [Trichinella britovi]